MLMAWQTRQLENIGSMLTPNEVWAQSLSQLHGRCELSWPWIFGVARTGRLLMFLGF